MQSKKILSGFLTLAFCLALAALAAGQDAQQKAAAAKEAAAKNQQALRSYAWTTTTKLSLKGEVKNTKIESCQYGPDGKVQKTELSEPPPPPEKKRGLKGKIVAKKTGGMKKELEDSAASSTATSRPSRRRSRPPPAESRSPPEAVLPHSIRRLPEGRRLAHAHHGLRVEVDASDRHRQLARQTRQEGDARGDFPVPPGRNQLRRRDCASPLLGFFANGGHVQAAVLGRQIRAEAPDRPNDTFSTWGFGGNVSGQTFTRWREGRDNFTFAVNGGTGIGRYITDLGSLGGQDAV